MKSHCERRNGQNLIMTARVALYRWIFRFNELTQEKGQIRIYRNPPPKTMRSQLAVPPHGRVVAPQLKKKKKSWKAFNHVLASTSSAETVGAFKRRTFNVSWVLVLISPPTSHRIASSSRVELTSSCNRDAGTIGRFRYIDWVKFPYRVAGKALALRAGKREPG